MIITNRDMNVLAEINVHGVMTTSQIAKLYFTGSKIARRRLLIYRKHGLIERAEGSKRIRIVSRLQNIYCLTKRGEEIIAGRI